MRWKVGASRTVHASHWLRMDMVEVTLPDGRRIDHEVPRMPRDGAATAVVVDERVLMIFRHRFIADRWGWELPGGAVEPDEEPHVGAAREVLEETGWEPGPLRHLTTFRPSSGWSDQRFHLFCADAAVRRGEPVEENEASRVEWRTLGDVRADLASGAIVDGLTQMGLAMVLARAAGIDLTGPDGWWDHGAPEFSSGAAS